MKTYRVTLARLAWIFGSVLVEADSFDDAFEKAKADPEAAEWPLDEDGEPCMGFSPPEVSRAYCEDEADPDHDGEPASAPSEVYLAAPALASALQNLVCGALASLRNDTEDAALQEAFAMADAALRSAGLEV